MRRCAERTDFVCLVSSGFQSPRLSDHCLQDSYAFLLRQAQQFVQRPGEAAEVGGRHGQGVPFGRDRPGVAGVVHEPHGDEGIELAAELEKLLVRQRGPITQDVIGEDEQPAKTLAEQPLPLGQAHQVIPR